jgi:hypothetical protein
MQEGLKLATIQVTPDPFFRMIVQRPFLAAFRTRPFVTPGMLNPNINPLGGNVKFHPLNRPRGHQPQQVPVKIGITHGSPPGFLAVSVA